MSRFALPWLESIRAFLLPTFLFFFNDTATTEIYTLSLHDALPIWKEQPWPFFRRLPPIGTPRGRRSEEHTSELQSPKDLVCRLLLEKKKQNTEQERATKTGRDNCSETGAGETG